MRRRKGGWWPSLPETVRSSRKFAPLSDNPFLSDLGKSIVHALFMSMFYCFSVSLSTKLTSFLTFLPADFAQFLNSKELMKRSLNKKLFCRLKRFLSMAATANASAAPRYAPEDPTLPKPWKGLVDGKIGYLYFWNPETDVTQYERPRHNASPAVPVSFSVQVQQSSPIVL